MTEIRLEELNLKRIHLVGVGGAGMNALTDVLLDLGYPVSGSDLKLSATTTALAARGATIFEGHRAENLDGATLVVKTAAARDDNPELVEAERLGLAVLTLAQMVGVLANSRRCLAIAGTHGKTTTTALVAWLLTGVGRDPTFFIGGVSQNLGVAGRAGKGEFVVVEADEYARRFLELRPEVALITNLEPDHLDYYGTFEAIIEAFQHYAWNVRPGGTLLAPLPLEEEDGSGLATLGAALLEAGYLEDRNYETYALVEELTGRATFEAVLKGTNSQGGYDFAFYEAEELLTQVSLSLPGIHNVKNVTAALALCHLAAPDVEMAHFSRLAGEFKGTQRRFEVKGETPHGVTVVDDYAHHPTELKATLAAARVRFAGRRLVALFQPHTFSRTKAHLDEFAQSFGDADLVALLEIFPARETDNLGVSSASLLEKIAYPEKVPHVLTHQMAAEELRKVLKPGDVLLTLGAGDVWKVGETILDFRFWLLDLAFKFGF
ncbi:MAG: UDP-N-acetylmuramate--L-alanine ligase [Chloroflexi bacterium]|nr:UDP-N-acetylmuramate--L-alanine ligase [Chloroflexota bacterium]